MIIPIVCETPGCPNEGKLINEISGIEQRYLDLFYESYDGSDEADYCPLCQQLGIAEDPEFEQEEHVGTKLLFENDRVRVWELAVAPGESLERHVHQNDYLYIVSSPGVLHFADPEKPEEGRDVTFEDNQVAFVTVLPEGKVDQRLTNVSDRFHRNYVIELLK